MEKADNRINVLANSEETIVLVPIVLEQVEVQVPLRAIVPEVRAVAIAVRILEDRAVMYDVSPASPSFEFS